MGLRESAEAARVQHLQDVENRKRLERDEAARREQARRAEQEELANGLADEIGFGVSDSVWIDEPVPAGYSQLATLFVCSDDGVWLRFVAYRQYAHSPIQGRFQVVDKCPTCPVWVDRGGFATTMSEIGLQLAKESRVPYHHQRTHGTPVPA